jgi:hypothetical protein
MEKRGRSEQPTAIGNLADRLQEQLRQMLGTLIGALIRSELDAVLGVIRYSHEAAARRSYRHASPRQRIPRRVANAGTAEPRSACACAEGALKMRRLDGWYDIPRVLAQQRTAAA